jgi:hypothetical protein
MSDELDVQPTVEPIAEPVAPIEVVEPIASEVVDAPAVTVPDVVAPVETAPEVVEVAPVVPVVADAPLIVSAQEVVPVADVPAPQVVESERMETQPSPEATAGEGGITGEATQSPISAPAVEDSNPSTSSGNNIENGSNKRSIIRALYEKARVALGARKEARLAKIMALVEKRKTPRHGSGHITNDDVEKLLRVSDATATRYLAELVRRGKLRLIGSHEHARYEANI